MLIPGLMTIYGPNDGAVHRLIEAARTLLSDEARALIDARIQVLSEASHSERAALRASREAARRAGRMEAFDAARADAADAYRQARRGGEVVPWLAVSTTITNAVSAVVVGDLLGIRDYEVLYRPWREVIAPEPMVPVGPGIAPQPFGVPRRRAGARTLTGPDR